MKDEILPLFRDVLLVCQEMDLLGGTFFALDGLKLPSNASKEWSGTKSEMHRKKERLEAKVQQLLEEHLQGDKEDDRGPGPGGPGGTKLERQVKRLQKQAERIEEWLKVNEAKYGTTGKEISSNLTDNESAKMKTAHGVIQGYNGQALVDGIRSSSTPRPSAGVRIMPMGRQCWRGPWRISRVWVITRSILLEKSSPLILITTASLT